MKSHEVIFYKDNSSRFFEMLEICGFEYAPNAAQFTLESRYRAAEFGDKYDDLSFFICRDSAPCALILAHKVGESVSFGGVGVKILSAANHLLDAQISKIIIETLCDQAKKYDCKLITIIDAASEKRLSDLGQQAFNYKATLETKLSVLISLDQDIEDIRKNIRSRYKTFINKGYREIKFRALTSENINRDDFQSFQNFHKKVAGRQTRPIASWDVQFEMIEKGCAELILGYMGDHGVVSSALFTDYGTVASYAVAVYERELFDKPLAHANVYEGILRAKDRGMKVFNLGVIPAFGQGDEKEYNIGNFKKGFCAYLTPQMAWSLRTESVDNND